MAERRPSGKIRAVLFDAGNTLAYPDVHRIAAVARKTIARDFEPEELLQRILRVMMDADGDPDFLRKLADRSVPPNWHLLGAFAALGAEEAELEKLRPALHGAHEDRHLWGTVNPDAPSVLDELRRGGYRLGVISNSEDGQAERLVDLLGVRHFFEFCVDSYVLGSTKPDSKIFLHAVEMLGTEPQETAYVGDMYTQDVVGASGAGLFPILLDPFQLQPERSVTRIRSLGELPELLVNAAAGE